MPPNKKTLDKILLNGPIVISLGLSPAEIVNRLLTAPFTPKPPRRGVLESLMRVVGSSKWMFDPKDMRIVEFTEDKPGSLWPKSLEWLPRNGASSSNFKLTTVSSVLPKPFPDDGWFSWFRRMCHSSPRLRRIQRLKGLHPVGRAVQAAICKTAEAGAIPARDSTFPSISVE